MCLACSTLLISFFCVHLSIRGLLGHRRLQKVARSAAVWPFSSPRNGQLCWCTRRVSQENPCMCCRLGGKKNSCWNTRHWYPGLGDCRCHYWLLQELDWTRLLKLMFSGKRPWVAWKALFKSKQFYNDKNNENNNDYFSKPLLLAEHWQTL